MNQSTDKATSKVDLRRRRVFIWGLLVVVALTITYGITLQIDINGSANAYAEDTGEFQNVLTQWGVAHPTGYPLYSLTGAAFASLARSIGVTPAAAASAYSDLITTLAMLGMFVLLCEWQVAPPLAMGSTLLLGLLFPFWYHASVAEVYALLIALVVLTFLIAARWQTDHAPRHLTELAFVFGLAVGHHRLAVVAAPALAVYVGPLIVSALRERPARILTAGLAFLVSGLVYFYLPLRAHSSWVYGDPGTWEGFWRIVTAREYNPLVRPAASISLLEGGFGQSINVLLTNMTWPLWVTGVTGLLLGLFNVTHRRVTLALLTLGIMTVVFVSIFSQAVFMPAALMPAMLAIVPGVGFLAQKLAERGRAWRLGSSATLLAGVVLLIRANGLPVWAITHDPQGHDLIDRVSSAQLDRFSPSAVVMSLWGRDYFALAYAHSVTGELAEVEMVDHRADVGQIVGSGQTLYVLRPTFYLRPLEWWDTRLGHAYLSSFEGDLVRVSNRPVLKEADVRSVRAVSMAPNIALRDWQVKSLNDRRWLITLFWQANARPDRDFSVFIHASDQTVIDSPDDIVAQDDSSAPVYGWYPTSRWSPGEIVRDDHVIISPADRPAKIVAVGLYTQDAAGNFQNYGQQIIGLP